MEILYKYIQENVCIISDKTSNVIKSYKQTEGENRNVLDTGNNFWDIFYNRHIGTYNFTCKTKGI